MFAIETRLHEEEEVRIKEFNFLKDLVKKLIYSLEQKDIELMEDNTKVPKTSYGESKLPSLMLGSKNNVVGGTMVEMGSPVKQTTTKNQTNEVEIMTLKRLNYLRSSLD